MSAAPQSKSRTRLLAGLDLKQLISIGSECAGAWQPPTVAEIAGWLPGYEVQALIGRGGMGAVYKARQRQLDRLVALKLLPVEASLDEAFAERFRREAQMLARLDHPNIVGIFDFGETTEGHLFYAMEFVEGEDLQQRLRRGLIDPGAAFAALHQVCAALECAHSQNIVHRDIKPANVLITSDGRVKLADFGLALPNERAPAERLTRVGSAMGTFEYAAPEQISGHAHIDHRADIYSVGVMAYELLTGELPRGVFPPPSEKAGADPRYDAAVLRALQQEPAKRWPSVREFRQAMTRAHEEVMLSGGTAFATTSAEKLQEFYQREMANATNTIRIFIEEELLTDSGARDNRAMEDAIARTGAERSAFEHLSASGLLRIVERNGTLRVELASDRLVPIVLSSRDERRAADERQRAANREAEVRSQLIRRNRLAVAFGILAVIAMLALAVAWFKSREANQRRTEAQQQEQSAVRARSEAEKLVDFMLTDLRAKLESENQLALLEETVAKAEAYFASLPELPGDPDFESRKARLFELKGLVERVQGRHTNALENLARAQEIRRQLWERRPQEKRWKLDYAHGLTHVALAHGMAQNKEASLAASLEAEKLFREVANEFGDASARDAQVEAGFRAGGVLKWMGRNQESLAKLRTTEPLAEKLASESPGSVRRQDNLAINDSVIGDLLLSMKDIEGALKHYRRCYEISEKQLALRPNDGFRVGRVAFSSSRLGSALLQANGAEEAVPHLQRAVYYTEDLAARSPHNLETQRDLAAHCQVLAQALARIGRDSEAAEVNAKRRAVLDFIGRRASFISGSRNIEADAAHEAGLRKLMAARFGHAVMTNAPTTSHWDWLVAIEELGDWIERSGSPEAAFAFYEQQRLELEGRANAASVGALWHWDLAFVLNRLGELHRKQNDFEAALKFYERALVLRRDVFVRSPETSRFRRDVISACEHVCEMLLSKRQPERALQHCKQLIELVSAPERASTAGSTYHNYAAKVCAMVIESTLQLEPALRRETRKLAFAAEQQLRGGVPDAELATGDQQLLARLRAGQ
jgi:serine/threonine protein kinase/tetratricopeptide (TPR) repeat protein